MLSAYFFYKKEEIIMGLYFCNNLILKKEALKMAYICEKTKEICPRVRYGVTGEANPDKIFSLQGCKLLKEKEKNTEDRKEDKKVEKEKIKEEFPLEQEKIEKEVKQKSTKKKRSKKK